MIDINSIGRSVESSGDDKTVVALTRTYDAEIADVWDAVTNPERLSRWFLPIEGDLRVGGTYQLKGNAGGTILTCEPPRRLLVTWVFAPEPTERDITEVEVRLREDGDKTLLELRHEATVDPAMWSQFGPGAVGVGWDLTLLGLDMHLEHGGGVDDPDAWSASPAGRDFIARSSEAWGEASLAFGRPADEVAAAVAATTAFYTPPADGESAERNPEDPAAPTA